MHFPQTISTTWDNGLNKGTARKIIIVVFWLALWQVLSVLVNNKILLAGPYEALLALIRLGATSDFWMSVLMTVLKITAGFMIGLILGIVCACLSYSLRLFREFITPPVSVI